MVKYECFRCGYITNHKNSIKNHFNRKNICNPIREDISIENMCKHYNLKISTFSTQNTTKAPHFSTFSTQNTTLLEDSENEDHICKYCNKKLSRIDSLTRHMKSCKKKKEESLQLCVMENKIKELEKKLDNNMLVTNNNTNSTNNSINTNITNSNSHNNNTNILNINNIGEENIKHISYNYYSNILKGIYGAVPKLVEKIHFDEEYPENQNIKLTNKKEPYVKLRKNNKWTLANRKIEVLDLIDSKCFLLRTKYNKILEMTNNLTEEQQNKIETFIKRYDEDNKMLMDDLILNTEIVLLNNSK